MTLTKEKMTVTAMAAAAEMAEKLEMHQTEITDCWADRPILVATPQGISMGLLKADTGEMRTYRYSNFTLNGELLFSDKFAITEKGWADKPTTVIHLDEEAIVYGGYGTL
jgi:hypothetical protein